MSESLFVGRRRFPVVDWLEIEVSSAGVRSISFLAEPPESSTSVSSGLFDLLVEQLEEYFRGERRRFTVPLDIAGGTDFQRRVWSKLCEIPYGETWSYARLATAVGVTRGARAVGGANGANPIPIIVPCHRVIRANGELGGFSSGTHIKERLLSHEHALTFQRP